MLRPLPFLCIGAAVLLASACTHKASPQPAEQPELMAGESRFLPMSTTQQAELEQVLEPFLRAEDGAELWYSASTRQDTGTFQWCVSPAPAEAEWVHLGSISRAVLQQLAAERTAVEHGDTLDYWMRFELRCDNKRLPFSICPAEEFGIHLRGCSPVRSRAFHRAVWQSMERRYDLQKRFDREVADF